MIDLFLFEGVWMIDPLFSHLRIGLASTLNMAPHPLPRPSSRERPPLASSLPVSHRPWPSETLAWERWGEKPHQSSNGVRISTCLEILGLESLELVLGMESLQSPLAREGFQVLSDSVGTFEAAHLTAHG